MWGLHERSADAAALASPQGPRPYTQTEPEGSRAPGRGGSDLYQESRLPETKRAPAAGPLGHHLEGGQEPRPPTSRCPMLRTALSFAESQTQLDSLSGPGSAMPIYIAWIAMPPDSSPRS